MGEQREFLTEKHAKFFQRCLLLLPAKLQGEDANRLSFIYFCLHGLGLLKQLKYTKEELQSYSDFIYKDYLLENDDFSAFRATPYFKGLSKYDLPNLSSTLFALLNLLILESDYSKVLDNHKVMKFLQLSQIKEGENKGSFAPTLRNGDNGEYVQFGETDVRLCYIAASIRHLVKYDTLGEEERKNDIDTKALTDFILLRIDYQGGLSFTKHVESHLGFSYCGIACLKLLGYEFGSDFQKTVNWLVHRQVDFPPQLYDFEYEYHEEEDIGAFNGRENKFGDTCYSWWCTASLALISTSHLKLVDLDKAQEYLLNNVQNGMVGGFSKDPSATPDPFHSFLGIASLALWRQNEAGDSCLPDLDGVDEALVITSALKKFFEEQVNY